MVSKVCLLANFNLYESKRYFIKKLAEAMERQGIETKIFDTHQILSRETTTPIRQFDPDFTCSFNSMIPNEERKFFWDYLKIPNVSFLVDPSFYSTDVINSPYSMITCVDRNDVSVIESTGFQNVLFWPHAVERELAPEEGIEREYDVVFIGSCFDYESLRVSWQQRHPESLNKVLDNAIDIVFSNDKVPLAEALVTAWNASGLSPEGVDFSVLYYYLDNYTRGRDRVELIRSIKNARVHVFGALATDNAVGILSWPQYLASQANVTVHPSLLFGDSMNILKRAKIVLNSMPFFRDGSHERIFTGLACGALPLTSNSTYLHEQFREGDELLFYYAKRKGEVNDLIDAWLSNEKKRQEAAAKGREKVMKHHTWDHRVKELVDKVPEMIARINVKNTEG